MISGNEKTPFAILYRALENPHFDPAGFHIGRAQMNLGLLYKIKKKRALALQLLKNLPIILRVMVTAPARIRALVDR
jgi:hypothetical protein